MSAAAPERLTGRRLEALTEMALFGMDERAYDINNSTGVNLSDTNENVRAQITEYVGAAGDRADYTAEDLWGMVEQYRLADAAARVVASRATKRRERLRQQRKGAGQ